MRITRRALLATGAAALATGRLRAQGTTESRTTAAAQALAALERRAGGRLGVAILETASGRVAGHRLDERFGMCSTFKLALAAMVLREADQGRLNLTTEVPITKADLVAYAPVTEKYVGKTMRLEAMAEAIQTTSDNASANLLLGRIGGPAGFTERARAAGDGVTRLDRLEPALNFVVPGDDRDTTSPLAMARLVTRYLTTDWMSAGSRERLAAWMIATTTGMSRIRAGLPKEWRAGDKTGTAQADGMVDKTNDIAVVWPPSGGPVVVTGYYDGPKATEATQDADQAVLAEVGRIAAGWMHAR